MCVCVCALVHVCLFAKHLLPKYGHYDAELSLRGPLLEINERQPRAKKDETAGPVGTRNRSRSTQGPGEEARSGGGGALHGGV